MALNYIWRRLNIMNFRIFTDSLMFVMLIAANGLIGEPMLAAAEVTVTQFYELPGDAVYPEGIAYHPDNGKFYVGSTSDGTLFEGDVTSGEVRVFSAGGADGRVFAVGMKVDSKGRLWVAGGPTGKMFVYDTANGDLIASYNTPEAKMTFINDVTIAPDGSAYFTDSFRPLLFRINDAGGGVVEPWLDFTGTVLEYGEGFNLNGIATTNDGRYLIVVHSISGDLFRIDINSREVIRIDLGESNVSGGDGLLLDGDTLYVVRNRFSEIVAIELSMDYSKGIVGEGVTDPSFVFPTTLARAGDALLVVISQLSRREQGPVLPFNVARIPVFR